MKIFIDATSALGQIGIPPSGIPRVENFILQAAYHDPKDSAFFVKYSHKNKAFMSLYEAEKKLLFTELDQSLVEISATNNIDFIKSISKIIKINPFLGKSFDRYLGKISSQRLNIFNERAWKTIWRVLRIYYKVMYMLFKPWDRSISIDLRDGVLLLSNTSFLSSEIHDYIKKVPRLAVINHDIIPLSNPFLAINEKFSKRFNKNLNTLIDRGCKFLSVSNSSRILLEEYARTKGNNNFCSHTFPMPSSLLSWAKKISHPSRMTVSEPYIICCSTIEVRKNHILLAKIWLRAIKAGIKIPKLICIGKWGWGNNDLIKYLDDHLELKEKIIFVGQVSDADLVNYYKGALFGVMPSIAEGWGLGASECLDFGVPVIVSKAPALLEATCNLMPSIDITDEDAWYDNIVLLSSDHVRLNSLRKVIVDCYTPTDPNRSWKCIKEIIMSE